MYRMVLLPRWIEQADVAVPLSPGTYTVGRSPKCDIVISHKSVSRQHARLHLNGSELVVIDLSSRNGTYVDDRLIEKCSVRVGQEIRFGEAPYRVALDGAEASVAWHDDEDETQKRHAPESSTLAAPLTASQKRVYDLLLDGETEAMIAAKLRLSVHTVHSHVKAIYTLFNVHSRAELLARLIKTR